MMLSQHVCSSFEPNLSEYYHTGRRHSQFSGGISRTLPKVIPPTRRSCSAAAASTLQASTSFELKDGAQLEVIRMQPDRQQQSGSAPLLFLHGSGHAAWCWQERFLPYFAERGYDSWAISLRGQGGSIVEEDAQPGTLRSNAADVADFIASLPSPPVVVAHSFGGLCLQKYVQQMDDNGWPSLAGTAYLASAPPSGNKSLVGRIMRKLPLRSVRITWGFITKNYQRNANAAKDLFFSEDIPDRDLQRYSEQFKANQGQMGIVDLKELSNELPIAYAKDRQLPPAFVGGGTEDVIVDVIAVKELADQLGVQPVIWNGMAHDVMLDTRWEAAAVDLESWLGTL